MRRAGCGVVVRLGWRRRGAAGEAGARVLLVEEQAHLGGSWAWQHGGNCDELVEELVGLPNVEIRCGTVAGGHYADGWVALFDAVRMTKVRAAAVVYANGAIEQPAVFGHNDLPGVLLGSAAQRLVKLYAVKPCDRMVVLAANSDAYGVALDMLDAGVEVAAIADLRPDATPSTLAEKVVAAGVPIYGGHAIYAAVPNGRKNGLRGAVVAPLAADGTIDARRGKKIACDGLVASVGWMPNAALPSQAGGAIRVRGGVGATRAAVVSRRGFCRRARSRGVRSRRAGGKTGGVAGLRAAHYAGHGDGEVPAPPPTCGEKLPATAIRFSPIRAKRTSWISTRICTWRISFNAHQEGYDSVELLKRYSTVGMGPSQGKLSNMNAMRILAKLNGDTIAATGSTTARPFYQPVPLGHLAGRCFHPMRRTAIHDWHCEHGAVFAHAGDWYRPEYYARGDASRDECNCAGGAAGAGWSGDHRREYAGQIASLWPERCRATRTPLYGPL